MKHLSLVWADSASQTHSLWNVLGGGEFFWWHWVWVQVLRLARYVHPPLELLCQPFFCVLDSFWDRFSWTICLGLASHRDATYLWSLSSKTTIARQVGTFKQYLDNEIWSSCINVPLDRAGGSELMLCYTITFWWEDSTWRPSSNAGAMSLNFPNLKTKEHISRVFFGFKTLLSFSLGYWDCWLSILPLETISQVKITLRPYLWNLL
jgi:hypothetical protein